MTPLAAHATHVVHAYGYGAVALAVGVESIGVPFPGEATLVAAALYAGATHRLGILGIVLAALAGAVIGDSIGFWLGRAFGLPLLRRFGPAVRITPPRIRLGQYLFVRHGGKLVFFGRFTALLRAMAAFLAGANRMAWPRFLVFNAAGGLVWSTLYGAGAYALGNQVHRLLGPLGIALSLLALLLLVASFVLLRRNETRLQTKADRLLLPHPRRAGPMPGAAGQVGNREVAARVAAGEARR